MLWRGGGQAAKETVALRDSGIQIVNDASDAYTNRMMRTYADNQKKLAECAIGKGWKPASSSGVFDGRLPLVEYFGVKVGSQTASGSVQAYHPLPEEIDLSVTLAECRRDLKIYETTVVKAREVQQSYVDANAPALLEFRTRITEVLRAAQDVLK